MSEAKAGRMPNFAGKHHNEASREKIAEYQRGRPKTAESRIKNSKAQGKTVIQLDAGGNVICEYWSANEASRRTGIANIRRAAGSGGLAGGFFWRYA